MPAGRRRTELVFAFALAALALGVGFARGGETAAGDPKLALVGRFDSPVYLTAPAGDRARLFVVEQSGRIVISRGGTTLPTPFLDIRGLVLSGGERGLLSLAFPPDYATSRLVYVYYTARNGAITVAEYRTSANPDVADPNTRRLVLSIAHPRSNHNGGQLQFGPDGFLYIGIGDGGGGGDPDRNGQNLGALLGKILRIDPRAAGGAAYTVPQSNPFVGQAGVRGEIWAYGLRNPWRFSFDRETGDLTIGDVGQGAWEEIDFVPASAGRGRGANFGWSCFEGRHAYADNSGEAACNPIRSPYVPPAWEYSHSRGCSISGGYVVRDPTTIPALNGRYVYGDYCDRPLWSVLLRTPDAQGDRRVGLGVPSLTSFGEDACGRVYVVSGDGPVYRLQAEGRAAPGDCPATAKIVCRVPKLVGLKLRTAKVRLRRAHCRAGRLRAKRSTAKRRGRVIAQSPRAGARRPAGSRVRMTVGR
ncbi:MAG TPA: PQQ-dependent sugar dehydrogenase [Gaiellaceae bacterium]